MRCAVLVLGLVLLAPAVGAEPTYRGWTAGEWADEIHRWVTVGNRGWRAPAWYVRDIFGDEEEVLPVALAMRRDPRAPVRAFVAAYLLGWMYPDAPTPIEDPVAGAAVRALLEMVDDKSPEVRAAVMSGLGGAAIRVDFAVGRRDPPDEVWPSLPRVPVAPGPLLREAHRRVREAMEDPVPVVRKAAERTLWWSFGLAPGPPPPQTIPDLSKLISHLASRNRYHARSAVETLGRLGERAEPAVSALVRAARTRAFLREDAIRTLGLIGPAASEAAPALREFLTDGYYMERPTAAVALLRVTGTTAEAFPALERMLTVYSERLRYKTLKTLDGVDEVGPEFAPHARRLLSDDWQHIRLHALHLLRRTEADREVLVAAHVRALDDPSEAVRVAAAAGLLRLDAVPAEALPSLRVLLSRSRSFTSRALAARAIARLGSAGSPAAADLGLQLGHENRSVRREVVRALAAIGGPGVRQLTEAAGHEKPGRRAECAIGLRAVRGHDNLVEPVLRRLLDDPSARVRYEAATAMVERGVNASEAVEVVVASFRNGDRYDREWTAEVLLRFGAGAVRTWVVELGRKEPAFVLRAVRAIASLPADRRAFLPGTLEKLAGDSDEDVRCQAVRIRDLLGEAAARGTQAPYR